MTNNNNHDLFIKSGFKMHIYNKSEKWCHQSDTSVLACQGTTKKEKIPALRPVVIDDNLFCIKNQYNQFLVKNPDNHDQLEFTGTNNTDCTKFRRDAGNTLVIFGGEDGEDENCKIWDTNAKPPYCRVLNDTADAFKIYTHTDTKSFDDRKNEVSTFEDMIQAVQARDNEVMNDAQEELRRIENVLDLNNSSMQHHNNHHSSQAYQISSDDGMCRIADNEIVCDDANNQPLHILPYDTSEEVLRWKLCSSANDEDCVQDYDGAKPYTITQNGQEFDIQDLGTVSITKMC